MKLNTFLCLGSTLLFAAQASALTIPSDGSDGAFNPTSSVVIDLSQAVTGAWDASNAANPGKGRYDSSKWAVVFKYSSVNIPTGVTVTFTNHPTHAPVVWLVQGAVTVNGILSLRGESGTTNNIVGLMPTEPGPGGFRGGAWGPAGYSPGYGIGGGRANPNGPGASYLTTYGNPQIVPLIGGSGGGAFPFDGFYTGGAGGGAILIASAVNMAIGGTIDVRGGNGAPGNYSQPGSGGAIRLIAQNINGTGNLFALQQGMTPGRIRTEANSLSVAINAQPSTIAVPPPATPIIWPADNAPTVRIVSVDGVAAPSEPTAPVISSTDVPIQNNGTVQVILRTTNFPTSGNVQVSAIQKYGNSNGYATWLNATYTSGNFTQANWVVNTAFAAGFTTLQVRATVP